MAAAISGRRCRSRQRPSEDVAHGPRSAATALARPGHVHAIGLGLQRVAGHGIGPGAAAAADMTVFADAAAAFEAIGIAERQKRGMVLIDVDHRIGGKTAAAERQEAGRIDLAACG